MIHTLGDRHQGTSILPMTSLKKHLSSHHRLREKCPVPGKHFIFLEGIRRRVLFHPRRHVFGRDGDSHLGANHGADLGEGEILGWSWVSPPYRWHF